MAFENTITERDMAAQAKRYSIQDAVKGVGVKWVRNVSTYDIEASLKTLRDAMNMRSQGPRVIVAEG
ncbi:MAG: hypothetical protein IIC12_08840, partial [Proteobacteria bacterium]|nr:hypothetical protein [Pseudomonadota bacterium]